MLSHKQRECGLRQRKYSITTRCPVFQGADNATNCTSPWPTMAHPKKRLLERGGGIPGGRETGAKWADLCSFAQEETERERENVVGNYLQQEFAVVRSPGDMSIRRLRRRPPPPPPSSPPSSLATRNLQQLKQHRRRRRRPNAIGKGGREGLDLDADDGGGQ